MKRKQQIIRIFLLCCFGIVVPGLKALRAQTPPVADYTLTLSDTLATFSNKEMKDFTLTVHNNTEVAFEGYVIIVNDTGIKSITKDSIVINHLTADQPFFTSLKIYATQQAENGSHISFVKLYNKDGALLVTRKIKLKIKENKMLVALMDKVDFMMPERGEYIEIPVRVVNKGNSKQSGIIAISYPPVLNDNENAHVPIVLNPQQDTTIVFRRKITRAMQRIGFLDISVNAVYADGDVFGYYGVSVQSLSSRKDYSRGINDNSDFSRNQIAFGVQNAFSNSRSYFLRSNADYQFKNGRVDYSFSLFKYSNNNLPVTLSGAYVDVNYKRVGFRVGNINIDQNSDFSSTGRGGELYGFLGEKKQTRVFVGVLDRSFALIDNQIPSQGKSFWTGFTTNRKTMNNSSVLSLNEDKVLGIKTALLANVFDWHPNDKFISQIKGSLGHTISEQNNETKNTGAISFTYNAAVTKNMQLTGNNFYAGGYYPGMRRGSMSLSQGVNWNFEGKSNLTANISYATFNPKYINQSIVVLSTDNKNTTANLLYGFNIGRFNTVWGANFYKEQGNRGISSTTFEFASMQSYSINNTISYNSIKGSQSLMLKTSLGGYTSTYNANLKFRFSGLLNYGYKRLRVSGSYQYGNVYLTDVFQEHYYSGGNKNYRFNVTPTYTIKLFNNSLNCDLGFLYSKDIYSENYLFSNNLIYSRSFASFFVTTQYNIYGKGNTYQNVQLGINYYLPKSRKDSQDGNGKIDVLVYYDNNRDGIFNVGDSVASDLLVRIGRTMFKISKSGHAVYKKLPSAKYEVYFATQNGWFAAPQTVDLKDNETQSVSMPLSQTGSIHGSIDYEFDATYSYGITKDKAWQSIVATNAEGIRFETRTNEAGLYDMYLPVGVYTLTVENLPSQVEVQPAGNNVQPLSISYGSNISDVNFILKVKQRKVEVKKFGPKK